MDRLLRDHWSSSIDAGGNLLGNSTSYKLLTQDSLDYLHDYEKHNRFYHKRSTLNVKPHKLMHCVWRESMEVRYFLEMGIFMAVTLMFQYVITVFNADYHDLVIDIHDYEVLFNELAETDPQMIALEKKIRLEVDHTVFDL